MKRHERSGRYFQALLKIPFSIQMLYNCVYIMNEKGEVLNEYEVKQYIDEVAILCRHVSEFAEIELDQETLDLYTVDELDENFVSVLRLSWFYIYSMDVYSTRHVEIFNYLFDFEFDEISMMELAEEYNEEFDILDIISSTIKTRAGLEAILYIESNYGYSVGGLTNAYIKAIDYVANVIHSVNESEFLEDFIQNLNVFMESCRDEVFLEYEIDFDGTLIEETMESQGEDIVVFEPEEDENESLEDVLEQLNQLIGMDTLKDDIQNIINLIKIQQMRKDKGMKVLPLSNHLVFTGNPGTGKTTVARLLAKIYKKLGLLTQGQLIEVDRAGLVAGYVGQTAIKTDEVIKKAVNGVLFIDEAYTLSKDDYGKEAIDTLLKRMEDYRENLIVIVAGYPEEMISFVESNPGLQSRFNKYIKFEDYTPEELVRIFEVMCKEQQYILDPEALEVIHLYVENAYINRDDNFANGRLIRNLFENTLSNQANRLVMMPVISDEELSFISVDDIAVPVGM